MRRIRRFGASCAWAGAAALVACVNQPASSFWYREPPARPVVHLQAVDEPLEPVWERLLTRLPQGSFRIEDMRRSSRHIEVSFSATNPQVLLDCGMATRDFRTEFEHRRIRYNPAASATYKLWEPWGPLDNLPVISDLHRKTYLQGRADVDLAQQGTETLVSVYARYLLSISVEGEAVEYDAFGEQVATRPVPARTETVHVTTTDPGVIDLDDGKTRETCRPSGLLERGILNLAQP